MANRREHRDMTASPDRRTVGIISACPQQLPPTCSPMHPPDQHRCTAGSSSAESSYHLGQAQLPWLPKNELQIALILQGPFLTPNRAPLARIDNGARMNQAARRSNWRLSSGLPNALVKSGLSRRPRNGAIRDQQYAARQEAAVPAAILAADLIGLSRGWISC